MKKSGRNRNIGKKKNEKITALAIISLIAVILLSGLLIKFSADKQELLGQISGLEGSVSHIREDESSKNAENDDEIKGLKESLSRAESEKIERENEIKKRDEKIKELEETNKKLQEMKKQREEEKKKPKPLPVPSGDKTVYLTFDDGPSAQTPKVLAVLKEYNVKATFFVTDIEPRYRSYMKDIVAGGHAIGLHTASHSYSDIYSSPENYFKDLNRISDIVEKETGVKSKIIRFLAAEAIP